ncbi:MAG: helix-turn-helix transcriptional regulator [Clostridia bacterium]|nr:helix-turn-helix transcriptional regulator [Clostridia bacterium]
MDIYIKSFLGVFINKRKKEAFFTSPRDFSVLSFRTKGNAVFYRNGKTVHVSENDILYVPKNIFYSQESETEDEIIAIHFKVNADLFPDLTSLTPKDSKIAGELFKKAYSLYTSGGENAHFLCLSVIYEILNLFLSKNTESLPPLLSKAIDIMDVKSFDSSFSIEALSESLSVSQAYLRMLFSKHLKTSPSVYLKNLRFERAKKLLETGYYSVRTVSEMSGYENEKNFSTAFKKFTGKCPSEYKK